MTVRYSLPFNGTEWSALRALRPEDLDGFSFVEARLDELNGFPRDSATAERELRSWLEQIDPVRGIAVWDRREIPNSALGSERDEWLTAIGRVPELIVDVDPARQPREASRIASDRPSRWIASFHDFAGTDSADALIHRGNELADLGPDVVKLSTLCRNAEDAMAVLCASRALAARGTNRIVVGMGETGRITRVAAALWGDWLVHAPRRGTVASAPGQLAREELEQILLTLSPGSR